MRVLTPAVACMLALGLASCSRSHGTAASGAPPRGAAPADPLSGRSLYALDLALTDQDGHRLALADLQGKVLVAAMMYGNCKSVCPRVTEDMKGIQRQLSGPDQKSIGFVLFSLNPSHDSPAALRAFAREHQLDLTRWRLFAPPEDGVRDLAAVLGVKYRPEPNGQIAHSAMIFVIDREGVVRHRQIGLARDPAELIAALARAAR